MAAGRLSSLWETFWRIEKTKTTLLLFFNLTILLLPCLCDTNITKDAVAVSQRGVKGETKRLVRSADVNFSRLPSEWRNICVEESTSDTLIDIHCNINNDSVWDFEHLRNWSAKSSNSGDRKIHLTVTCTNMATIFLPWPFRARDLQSLKIKDCVIYGYFADHDRPDLWTIPDSLQTLEIRSVTVVADVATVFKVMSKSISMEYECGPLNVSTFVYSDVRYEFYIETVNFTSFPEAIPKPTHTCNYANLVTYDHSIRESVSYLGIELLSANAKFPELRTLNFSFSELLRVPKSLRFWRDRFPAMDLLDLSHNNISRFSFVVEDETSVEILNKEPAMIDLRYNQIRTLTAEELNSFRILMNTVVDVRNNPFTCECTQTEFGDFLNHYPTPQSAGLHADYAYLWDLECTAPPARKGCLIARLSTSCNSSCSLASVSISLLLLLSLSIKLLNG